MHPTHPTLHELARVTAPHQTRHHDHHVHPARVSLRTRRDLALVRMGAATVQLGLRLGAAGRSRGALHRSGAPPDPRVMT